ncbi:MAG: alpha-amylase family glycosyl hydrolase [Chthoniobacterales bacterium]
MPNRLFSLFLWCSTVSLFADQNFFQPSPRWDRPGDIIYLLMPDRFNRSPMINSGAGESPEEGVDPTNPDYFHGGNLRGVTDKLDYLQRLGVTAVWMTPILKNRAVQHYGSKDKAGYHGYWVLDFTAVDPHFGTRNDFTELVEEGRKHGIGIIFDVVANHTADVIIPANGVYQYQYKYAKPYLDANGRAFDDRQYVNSPNFPTLDPIKSFPVPPAFRNEAERHIKVPEWLNDPTVYHNRGGATTAGEGVQYGDISGLDDLFTEQLRVVDGMIQIYRDWIAGFDLRGLRLDSVKHVNNEFWQRFVPAMYAAAEGAGRKEFLIFGEVYDLDPAVLSDYLHRASMPSVVDFGFQQAIRNFSTGKDPPARLAEFFLKDDYYTTPNSNAYGLVTFTGNHDMGRIGYFLRNDLPDASDLELVQRDILAHALLFFSRGIPAIYYGDEQGFAGLGGDYAARQDMFGSRVPEFAAEKHLGGGSGNQPSFDEQHPLFRSIQTLISVRRKNPALQSGTQVGRFSEARPGLFAFSRINRGTREEILVMLNNATEPRKADIPVYSAAGNWECLYRSTEKGINFGPGPKNQLTIELAPLSVLVLRNPQPIESSGKPIDSLSLKAIQSDEIDDRWEVRAETMDPRPLSVSFAVRVAGETEYKFLGTDDSPPYRIFPTRDEVPNASKLEFKAIARDLFGIEATAEFSWQRPNPVRRPTPSSER